MGLECGWRHVQNRWAENLRILKFTAVEGWHLTMQVKSWIPAIDLEVESWILTIEDVLYSHIITMTMINYTNTQYIYICSRIIMAQWITTRDDFFRKICTSHFIVTFDCERELEIEQRLQYNDSTLMAISVVSFSFSWCSTGGPGAELSAECWLSLPHLVTNGSPKLLGLPRAPSAGSYFPYHILSAASLVPNLSGAPTHQGLQGPPPPGFLYHISNFSGPQLIRGPNSSGDSRDPSAGLSLPHLISNWSPKLHLRSRGPLRLGVAFPTTSCLRRLWSPTQSGPPTQSDFLSWLSYIIVQRPLNLWNGMFVHHQVDITVKQFTGHSLSVH